MDKRYKNTYRCYLRLIKRNHLYNIESGGYWGYIVGYHPNCNYFLLQRTDRGWTKNNVQELIDQGYIIAKTIKTPSDNLWNVEINGDLIRELFKQQSSHN